MVIVLSVCGCVVEVTCSDPDAHRLLIAGYGRMAVSPRISSPDVSYRVEHDPIAGVFNISREGVVALTAHGDSEFLFVFEKDLSIELQRRRPDLFFLHAAVIERKGKAALLAAPSGTGKSTLTLALLHSGFRYLSDELAPVDLATMLVNPYPHALCLKAEPPEPFRSPVGTLRTPETLHIPTSCLPAEGLTVPVPLAAIFFVHRRGETGQSIMRPVSPAGAAARLYANALNPLAHPMDGLDAAGHIAQSAPGYELDSTDLLGATQAISVVMD